MFREAYTTSLPSGGAVLRCVTPKAETRAQLEERHGATDYVLELDGEPLGQGSILFHYNLPYVDLSMEVNESVRRRGFGSYIIQELKRAAYELVSHSGVLRPDQPPIAPNTAKGRHAALCKHARRGSLISRVAENGNH